MALFGSSQYMRDDVQEDMEDVWRSAPDICEPVRRVAAFTFVRRPTKNAKTGDWSSPAALDRQLMNSSRILKDAMPLSTFTALMFLSTAAFYLCVIPPFDAQF